jgi:NAD(P)H-hydrate epimerase
VEILTADEMRRVDRRAVSVYGIPEIVLMENAGLRMADVLFAVIPDLLHRRVLVLCGRGNNGGDGLVVARHLAMRGVAVRVLLFARRRQVTGSAALNLAAARGRGIVIDEVPGVTAWRRARRALGKSDLVVDALLGTGLTRPVEGFLALVIADVTRAGVEVVAADIPSGLEGGSGAVRGPALRAAHTVTFCRPKWAHVVPPAADLCGRVHVVDIGIPAAAVAAARPALDWVEPASVAATLPDRPRAAHKGTFGHVLVIAGSRGKGGAARMTSLAALRAGAGLVTAAVPRSIQQRLISGAMEAMTEGLEETPDGSPAYAALPRLLGLLPGKSAVALGPGLTTHPETKRLVRVLAPRIRVPLVLDADGLNAFEGDTRGLAGRRPLILTPHPGEMARLTGVSARAVQADRPRSASTLARRLRCHVVLKGHRTIVARPDGRLSVNPTGNPGMATGGSGDVLCGLLAGFLAQGQEAGAAARAAVYLHGLAGDLAADRVGEMPLMARDLIADFPRALRRVRATPAPLAGTWVTL